MALDDDIQGRRKRIFTRSLCNVRPEKSLCELRTCWDLQEEKGVRGGGVIVLFTSRISQLGIRQKVLCFLFDFFALQRGYGGEFDSR